MYKSTNCYIFFTQTTLLTNKIKKKKTFKIHRECVENIKTIARTLFIFNSNIIAGTLNYTVVYLNMVILL